MIHFFHNPHAFDKDCLRYYQIPFQRQDAPKIQDCELVAIVNTDSLESAYRLTQATERFWWENEKVELKRVYLIRSTSVGDLLAVESGEVYMVAVQGFILVDDGIPF